MLRGEITKFTNNVVKMTEPNSNHPLFEPDKNCWRATQAHYASPIIDCENYYRALHEAISNARHSIFIVGWDIDSRIELLRGEEALRAHYPASISELLAQKATENPSLNVYLLRWDSSLAFFSMREMWAKEVWDNKTPDNVHTWLDDTIPMGGSQHQKIVVVDDELVFSGGMDIALHRWDTREHRANEPLRVDDDGPYVPLHDVQSVMSGPVVAHFAQLVRWRWNRIADIQAIPLNDAAVIDSPTLPKSWPASVTPAFENIDCAIARTIPFMDDVKPVQEVRHMLLDLIAQAENFIYIENQFASREEIAEALNKQLKAKKNLRVLVVSSYCPKGTAECEAYWSGRIDFKKILHAGVAKGRVLMAYSSMIDAEDRFTHKRIHSKTMTIDDKYLVIGSSNISNRSMTLDTECDVIFSASNEQQREKIRYIRNDLVSEHSGWAIDAVDGILSKRRPFKKLQTCKQRFGYCLREIQDEVFTDQSLYHVVQPFSDPEEPIVKPFHLLNGKRLQLGNPPKKALLLAALALFVVALVGGGYLASEYIPWLNADTIKQFLENTRGTVWALPAVVAIFALGGLIFFPVTVLALAVAAVFGPLWGPIYGICGALASASLLFMIGRCLGGDSLKKYGGQKVRKVDEKLSRSGIVGVAAIRLIPIAPFSLVNLIAGISSIRFYQFFAGTFLGMFPPMIAKGLVGDSLTQTFIDPSPASIAYLAGGIVAWIAMIYASQKFVNFYQRRQRTNAQEALA